MKESVSSLMDGELDRQGAERVLAAMKDDESLRTAWREYHLIGDSLRGNRLSSLDVTRPVSARLAEEPTVLAPRRWMPRQVRNHPRTAGAALALAASVSFAAVVAWQQLGNGLSAAPGMLADRGVPVTAVQQVSDNEDPYFLAHQEMATEQDIVKVSYGNGAHR
ncbi:sigma-E factor negative regulatory protein [Paludibacterium paludis]|uniref:Anti sigma-E protein RseA N-terminal domain-containing protein n=1 Tax=Paludibacterium paludis TaxID=1225769 RepID=A0A918U7A1_9NEIS|nr:sigma-E factor negative regulatory protein [Paludibacterium paludis]GGY06401.1 hypothetical protein GCM10011289_06100 [Paludibacterium paludis]